MSTPTLVSIIDIDASDAFVPCAGGTDHGPAYGRVVFGKGDVRRLCTSCCVATTGSLRTAEPPRVGYSNDCWMCEMDACRVHGNPD